MQKGIYFLFEKMSTAWVVHQYMEPINNLWELLSKHPPELKHEYNKKGQMQSYAPVYD